MDNDTERKIAEVCKEVHSIIWTASSKLQGDGDGYGSAMPQNAAWVDLSFALAKLVTDNHDDQKRVREMVMTHAPKDR